MSSAAAGTVHTVIDSPYDPLTLVATDGVLSGVWLTGGRHVPPRESFGERDPRPFGAAIEQLGAYFAGELREFTLPLAPRGTDFQLRVWAALRRIPYGVTWSYGRLAAELGSPGASRAVGLANGRNPLPIVVPCHRVIGADGSLTGYSGGIGRKRALLEAEGALPGPPEKGGPQQLSML